MTPRNDYLVLLLQSLGLPLLSAVQKNSSQSSHEFDASKEAQKIAELLASSQKLGRELRHALDLSGETDKKSLRIVLTTLAAQLVASLYDESGKIPNEHDVKRMLAGFESVLTFSDQFTPEADSVERLKALAAEYALFDGYQLHMQYLQSCLPVIRAVSLFSFGQPESKLVKDICDKLAQRAADMRLKFFGEALDINQVRMADLAFLRMLAGLYADCHEIETQRLARLDETARASIQPASVWAVFEQRAQMLDALAESLLPLSASVQEAVNLSAANENTESGDDDQQATGTSNPMTFFKK
ncbi:MAG: hypothetical protein H6858_08115 [Rhodospirillales bacterium]|nr:hypothetical protein [Alphaproteobacteria bacterium]MCB1839947.1 hypothetical protein [Alphaproteobacteria bacterium]MCB9977544.1 hypothetical protein [Rhodospirillales bacterium]